MRVAFVGKGGSGKTTLCAGLASTLVQMHVPVWVVDADINQHAGSLLGFSDAELNHVPSMSDEFHSLKEFVRGKNSRIKDVGEVIKTTPPGSGSSFFQLSKKNTWLERVSLKRENLNFLRAGKLVDEDLGVKCFHSKTGAVELFLNHLVDLPSEWVLVDMTAGSDAFASGLFAQFDVTIVVVEPTLKSAQVFHQYSAYAKPFGVKIIPVGNKVMNEADREFIEEKIGEPLRFFFGHSDFIRHSEQRGWNFPYVGIETSNRRVVEQLVVELSQIQPDFGMRYSFMKYFHVRNAESWANAALKKDLREQIDPGFHFDSTLYSSLDKQ